MDPNRIRDIEQILSNGTIRVPFFQRSYVWPKENWERLLQDAKETMFSTDPYFMGTLIIKEIPTGDWSLKEGFIDDGQQRMTTIILLMKAH